VVGEEHRPEGVTMEFAVATTWLLRAGVLFFLVGIGFYMNYAFDQNSIGPMVVAGLLGLGLIVGGIKMFGGRYGLLGQGLAGTGFATLYFSFYTVHQEYEMLGATSAFGVMILVTLASGFVAVRFNSLLISVLELLGGYLTPMMVTIKNPSVVGLFSYVLMLGLGVFFSFAAYLVDFTYRREAIALVTIGLAVFCIIHIYSFLKRKSEDKGLILSFLGLASLFVAITLPLVLSHGWITVSWAVQGFVMLWIAAKMKSEFLRQLAYVLYLIVLGRFALLDLVNQFSGLGRNLSAADYWPALLERLMVFGVPIASFFAAGRLFGKQVGANAAWIVGEQNDIKPWLGQSMLSRYCDALVLVFS